MDSSRGVIACKSTRWQCVVEQKSNPSAECLPRNRTAYVRAASAIARSAASDRNTLLSPASTPATYRSTGSSMTVDLPPDLVKKLDCVVTELAAKDIPANRAFVVRAVLRAAPDAADLAPAVKRYLADFPARPRGWAARKARTSRTR